MKALIVVDMQNDFVKGGSLEVKDGEKITPIINDLIAKYKKNKDIVIATRDFHPKNHISFASTHKKEPFDIIEVSYGEQQLWPDHCVQGTTGAEFVKDLDIKNIDRIIEKGTNKYIDSYSGFFENDGNTQTELDEYLRANRIKEMEVVGLALDYCVGYTAIDAAKLGYKVSINLKGTKPINEDISEIKKKFKKLNIELLG